MTVVVVVGLVVLISFLFFVCFVLAHNTHTHHTYTQTHDEYVYADKGSLFPLDDFSFLGLDTDSGVLVVWRCVL